MKKIFWISIFLIIIITELYLFLSFYKINKKPTQKSIVNDTSMATQKPLIIILSPHLDDAVLSLGGFMATRKHQLLIATFFTHRPAKIVHTYWDRISGFSNSDKAMFSRIKENRKALAYFNAIIKNYDYPDFQYRKENQDEKMKNEIIKSIQFLINTYKKRELFLYGPGIFGLKITHPDHKIVHDAFIDIYKINKNTNIHFFIYEDFPYISKFQLTNLGNFNNYLDKQENISFKEEIIQLNKSGLKEKLSSIELYKSQIKAFFALGDNILNTVKKFNQSRCKTFLPSIYACEVVYSF